ncbi:MULTISPECIES: substrate-binding periplasmic protein [Massilia]|uniref:Transporter substrate-binding domain-containing protein n=2 Tax=Massilia TaxID=149698 RepID=A0ABX0MUZ4_9BURK|nr:MULTISPECIES: transporter substrate-binding domain-containing protein [Massilia]NHZ66584.1 transporter substrate-binding domain-containing protein [Massilia genomosp. 1]NHZ93029.1 transporter substrate-binding domain-containing protein [Massilia mucilaginosa]
MRREHLFIPLFLFVPFMAQAADSPKLLHLASLEWPPFASAALPNNGASGAVVDAAAKFMGSTVKVEYFPWKDTVAKGSNDPAFIGYFPVFITEERAKSCYFSAVIGKSSTGIGFLKDTPITWKTIPDLASIKLGVVEAYANGDALDEAIKQGKQQVEVTTSDTNNVRKLVSKKLPAIVVDKAVLRYMTLNSAAKDSVMFHEKMLLERSLNVCFQRTPAGKAAQESFDAALKKVNVAKIEEAYFKSLEEKKQ